MSHPFFELILTTSLDGPVTVYDITDSSIVSRFNCSRTPRGGLVPVGGNHVAASNISPAAASSSIHLYPWWSNTISGDIPMPEPVMPLAATADGSYLFSGGASGSVYAASVDSGRVLRSVPAHEKPVSCLHICDDGSILASGGEDGTVVCIPIFRLVGSGREGGTGELILHKFSAHSGSVTAIASGKGLCHSQIITASLDGTCKFWSLLRGTHLRTMAFSSPVTGLILNPSELEFYTSGSDGSVYQGFIDIGGRAAGDEPEVRRWSPSHERPVVSLGMGKDGTRLVSGSEDGSLWVWRVDYGQLIMAFQNEVGRSISGLIVVNRTECNKDFRLRPSGGGDGGGVGGKELGVSCGFPVKETMEMQSVAEAAERDQRRAIDLLESAIAMYERLLELILKESQRNNKHKGERQ